MYLDEKREGEVQVSPLRKTFLNAAQMMRERGWCRGTLCNERRQVCILGALHFGNTVDERNFQQAVDILSEIIRPSDLGIAEWNDHLCASKGMAIALLEKAAQIA